MNINSYKHARYTVFKTRYEMSFIYKIVAVFLFAAFTGIMAQMRVYLPFTPVPVTGQVLPALLAGFVLGKWYGGFSQLSYALLGGLGIPWGAPKEGMNAFTSGGAEWLFGATGGYVLGFIMAAFFIGYFTDSYVKSRTLMPQFIIMLIGVAVIYLIGAVWLYYSLGASMSLEKLMAIAVLPFIPADLAKAAAAALLGSAALPKEPFAREKDSTI